MKRSNILVVFPYWNFALINDLLKLSLDISYSKMITRAKIEMQKDYRH